MISKLIATCNITQMSRHLKSQQKHKYCNLTWRSQFMSYVRGFYGGFHLQIEKYDTRTRCYLITEWKRDRKRKRKWEGDGNSLIESRIERKIESGKETRIESKIETKIESKKESKRESKRKREWREERGIGPSGSNGLALRWPSILATCARTPCASASR